MQRYARESKRTRDGAAIEFESQVHVDIPADVLGNPVWLKAITRALNVEGTSEARRDAVRAVRDKYLVAVRANGNDMLSLLEARRFNSVCEFIRKNRDAKEDRSAEAFHKRGLDWDNGYKARSQYNENLSTSQENGQPLGLTSIGKHYFDTYSRRHRGLTDYGKDNLDDRLYTRINGRAKLYVGFCGLESSSDTSRCIRACARELKALDSSLSHHTDDKLRELAIRNLSAIYRLGVLNHDKHRYIPFRLTNKRECDLAGVTVYDVDGVQTKGRKHDTDFEHVKAVLAIFDNGQRVHARIAARESIAVDKLRPKVIKEMQERLGEAFA